MPELPEVETVRQVLRTQILNKTIKKITVLYDGIIKDDTVDEFKRKLVGKTLIEINRKGKYLFFMFDDIVLISHLRMEGKFYLRKINEKVHPHEHVIFELDDIELRYDDVRKFGTMQIRSIDELFTTKPIDKLGMEPLTSEFTVEKLKECIKVKKKLKVFLLEQQHICGIGNIYADEICFLAKLHPETITTNLNDEDILNIYNATNTVLKKAISLGGTTIKSYTSSLGVTGRFQLELNVHQRANLECKTCKTIITKTKVNGRGTYICLKCQVKK